MKATKFMRIVNCEVKNFRSIRTLKTSIKNVNAIYGPNGCGKSNLMRAIRFAFVKDYSPSRMAPNVCNSAQSANATARVSLRFSGATKQIASLLELNKEDPFTYTVSVKRNGSARFYVNGADLTVEKRKRLIAEFLIINVPAIRDVMTDGLNPLRQTFTEALVKTRGSDSLVQRQERLQRFLERKGNVLLKNTHTTLHGSDNIDGFILNAKDLNILDLIDKVTLQVQIGKEAIDIDKVGTGYQSSLVIQSYRQLGAGVDKPVFFFFEEPDNHLHPTSMRAMAEQLKACGNESLSQVFFTTHSPYLLNQFTPAQGIGLTENPVNGTQCIVRKLERSERELRISLSKFGLTASEAALVKSTVVVEGPLDKQLVRTLVELERGQTCDQLDISIISAGGKSQVLELGLLLRELGLSPICVFDWDATKSGNVPYFSTLAIENDSDDLHASIECLLIASNSGPSGRKTRIQKSLESMKRSLSSPEISAGDFRGSILHKHLSKLGFRKKSDEQKLETYAKRCQIQNLRNELAKYSIWIWKGTPESGLIRDVKAAMAAADVLLRSGFITTALPENTESIARIQKTIHKLAHEPLILAEIIQSLWNQGFLHNSEPKKLVNFILSGV